MRAFNSNFSFKSISILVISTPVSFVQTRLDALQRLSANVPPRFQIALWFPVFFRVMTTSPVSPGSSVIAGFSNVF